MKIYYEIYGKGEPIVVLAGRFMDIGTMAQSIGPLSRERDNTTSPALRASGSRLAHAAGMTAVGEVTLFS